jgi:hypothetical protein
MGLLIFIVNVGLGLVIINAFIPVFVALNAEFDLIRVILEFITRLFTW